MGAYSNIKGTYLDHYIFKTLEASLESSIIKVGPTITISGLSGSGKTKVSKKLSEEFKLDDINAGDVYAKLARIHKVDITKFSGEHDDDVDYGIDKGTLELAYIGNVIITGRMAGWVAGGHADIRIHLFCPEELRIKRITEREYGKSATIEQLEDIRKKTTERDKSNRERYIKLYNKDIFSTREEDLSIYNLKYNSAELTLDEMLKRSVENVREILKEKGFLC